MASPSRRPSQRKSDVRRGISEGNRVDEKNRKSSGKRWIRGEEMQDDGHPEHADREDHPQEQEGRQQ